MGVEGSETTLMGCCDTPQNTEASFAAAYEIAQRNPASLRVILPYFRSARMERKAKPENAVMAKVQAHLWSSLGTVYPGIQFTFASLHTDLILNYFHGAVRTSNVRFGPALCMAWLVSPAGGNMKRGNAVIASVDEGGASEVRRSVPRLSIPGVKVGTAFIQKRRVSPTETKVIGVEGDVAGKNVLILDDILSTGSSMMEAAKVYRARGALSVCGAATHGVLPNTEATVRKLKDSGVLDGLWLTETHPNAVQAHHLAPEFIRLYDRTALDLLRGCTQADTF
jgi:ribose-phosphate pyrophosphokinase